MDAHEDDPERAGNEPLEEVGPQESEAQPADCGYKAGELDGQPQDCQFNVMDEVAEAFPIERLNMVPSPVDGLPIPSAEMGSQLALAAPFNHDTVVCIEDEREYVEKFTNQASASLFPLPGSKLLLQRPGYGTDGKAREPMRFEPSRVETLFGDKMVRLTGPELRTALADRDTLADVLKDVQRGADAEQPTYLPVKPRRERCEHYKRQVFANDDQPDMNSFGHRIMFRNCAARRSVGGALMSLRDEAVYACDYREPPEPLSVERYLDAADRNRIANKESIVQVPLFGITSKPAAPVTDEPASPGGIFKP